MKNSKIIKIVKALSKEELKSLEKFVNSPIHNRHKDVIKLFLYFKKHLHGNPEKLAKERIFKHLFPNLDFEMQKVHYVSSYLLKVVEEFLAWQEWKLDSTSQQMYLIRAYNRHHLVDQQNKSYSTALKIHENQNLRNSQYYWQRYQLQFGQLDYYRTLGRSAHFNLQEYSELLDIFFVAEKLKSSCGMISHQSVSKQQYDLGLLPDIISFIQKKKLLDIPAIATYFYAYQALTNIEDLNSIHSLKKLLFNHEEKFSSSELRDIYLLAININIKRFNMGNHDLMAEIFELYKRGLGLNVFLEKGYLSRFSYNNTILAGMKMKEYDWVKNFIHDYAPKLHPAHREASFSFNLAKYNYEIGNYAQAMRLMLQMEYDDTLHNLQAKSMLAKIYYEQEEIDAFDNLLKSARTYINRKDISDYLKKVHSNNFIFFKKLIQINPFERQEVEKLREEIITTKVLTEKEWLLNQLDKMK